MTKLEILPVDLKHCSYKIHIGAGLLASIKDYLPESLHSNSSFYICDQNTKNYTKKIAAGAQVFVVPSGERAKSMDVYRQVLSFLLDHNIGRKSTIFAVGGGVVGDLAGFAAATVLRGVPVIQVPTTLLAMVDSSVGGKTGINMPQGKNLVGAFHQPAAVICDLDVLKTLPERELKAGYAEILKYGLLGDSNFYDWLEENGRKVLDLEPEALSHAIKHSCQMKADIVIEDEKETSGKRALLNLGHTFAHAFEAAMGYDGRLLHGEAVAVGMVCAMELSAQKELMHTQNIERVVQHMAQLNLIKCISDIGLSGDIKPESLLDIMHGDKKAQDGKISFVLMKGIGRAFLSSDVSNNEVITLLNNLMEKK